MSASVIRRGLELFSEKDGGKRKQKKSGSRKPALMDQISSDKQRVQRRLRQLQRPRRPTANISVKHKRIRSAVDEFRKKQKKSQMSSNLQYFLSTGAPPTSSSSAAQAAQRRSGAPARPPSAPSKGIHQEKSVFSEKDFQKFQQEYFSKL